MGDQSIDLTALIFCFQIFQNRNRKSENRKLVQFAMLCLSTQKQNKKKLGETHYRLRYLADFESCIYSSIPDIDVSFVKTSNLIKFV